MACNAGPDIIEDGLVLCLDAANINSYPKSGTTWSDLAGSNDGTLTNMDASNFSAANGGSLVFDGTNDEVLISSSDFSVFSLTATQGVTVSCWVKLDSSTESRRMLSSSDSSSGLILKYDASNTAAGSTGSLADKFTFFILVPAGGKSGSVSSVHSTTSPDGNWINVVGTRESSGVFKIYINGVLEATNSGTSSAVPTPTSVKIGDTGEQSISLLYYHNRALTATEVAQNFNVTRHRFGI